MAKYRSRISLQEFFEKIPKDSTKVKDYFFSNIENIKSEELGLNQKPVTLLDVLSYQDDPKYKDFDFFETYENSEAAKKNLAMSEEWISKLNNFTEEETQFVDELYASDVDHISSMIVDRVKLYVEELQETASEKPKTNQEDNNGTD